MNKENVILPKEKPHTLEGRVQRLFDVYHPKKKVIKPSRYLNIRLCLTGLIPSKKNDYYSENNIRMVIKQAVSRHGYSKEAMDYIHNNSKSWIRGSKKYIQWLSSVDAQLMEQIEFWRVKFNLQFPLECVSIKNYYWFADRMARDFISKDESVYDMLVTKKIIIDDNYGVLHKTISDGGCYKDEIVDHIVDIDITIAIFD